MFMKKVGADQGDIVAKCDQEPAMTSLTREIGAHRAAGGGARMVVESSPVGDSKGNGVIERAAKSVQGQARVLRGALEERIGAKLDPHHAVFPWTVEYASLMLNRFEVGRDGRTAYERNKQKKAKTSGMEFGEAVLWKRKASGGLLGKLHACGRMVSTWGSRRRQERSWSARRRGYGGHDRCEGNRLSSGGRPRTWRWWEEFRGR